MSRPTRMTAEASDEPQHNTAVRTQFALQASTFTDTGFAARGLDWIVDEVNPSSADLMLDVAAGAAHLGRAFAPRVAHVSALDLTPEMLEQGKALAQAAGIRNIAFLRGDAVSLPWISGQFDLAACRLTLHQVADPATGRQRDGQGDPAGWPGGRHRPDRTRRACRPPRR